MSKSTIWTVVALLVVIVAVVLVVLLVPGKNNNNNTKTNTLSNTQKAAYTKQIKDNVTTFFAASTSIQARENLLQNGAQFAPAMQAEFTQLNAQKPSVNISSISFTNPTTAQVKYSVYLNGQPVLANQTGSAVLIDHVWKVSDVTLCQLLGLGGSTPQICKNIH